MATCWGDRAVAQVVISAPLFQAAALLICRRRLETVPGPLRGEIVTIPKARSGAVRSPLPEIPLLAEFGPGGNCASVPSPGHWAEHCPGGRL